MPLPASTFGGPAQTSKAYKDAVLGRSAAEHSKQLAVFSRLQHSKGLTSEQHQQRSDARNDLAERAYYGGMDDAPINRRSTGTPGAKAARAESVVAGARLGFFYQPVSENQNDAGELGPGQWQNIHAPSFMKGLRAEEKLDKVYDRIAEPQVQLEDLNAPLAQVNSIKSLAQKMNEMGIVTSQNEAKDFLEDQDTYQRNRQMLGPPKTLHRIRATAPGQVFQCDTVEILNGKSKDVSLAAGYNMGWNKVLTCVDVFTRVVFVVPIHYKKKDAQRSPQVGQRANADHATYMVDEVLDDRKESNGKRKFLISWEGYDASSNTWEPEDGVRHTTPYREYMEAKSRGRNLAVRKPPAAFKPDRADGKEEDEDAAQLGIATGTAATQLIEAIFDYYNGLLRRGCDAGYREKSLRQWTAVLDGTDPERYMDDDPMSQQYKQTFMNDGRRRVGVRRVQPAVVAADTAAAAAVQDMASAPIQWRNDRGRADEAQMLGAYGYYKGPQFIQTDRGNEFGYTGENLVGENWPAQPDDISEADYEANKAKQKNTSIRNFRGVRGGWRDMISRVPVKYANLLEKDGSRRRLGGLEFVNDGDVLRYKDPKQLCVGGVPGNPNGQAYIESWHKTLRARLRVQFDVERPGAYMDPDQRYLRTDQSRGRAQHDTGADLNTGTSRGRKNTRSSVQAKPTGLVGEAERNQIQAALDPRGQGLHFMERDIANAKGADAVDDHESGKQVWMAGDQRDLGAYSKDAETGRLYNLRTAEVVEQGDIKTDAGRGHLKQRRWVWILPFVVKDYNAAFHSRLRGVPSGVDFTNYSVYAEKPADAAAADEDRSWYAKLTVSQGTRVVKWVLNPLSEVERKNQKKISEMNKNKPLVRLSTASNEAGRKKMDHYQPAFANVQENVSRDNRHGGRMKGKPSELQIVTHATKRE